MEIINDGAFLPDNEGYEKVEKWNAEKTEKIAHHYSEILKLLGEDIQREGLVKTPMRVSKAMQFLTHGYSVDPSKIDRKSVV